MFEPSLSLPSLESCHRRNEFHVLRAQQRRLRDRRRRVLRKVDVALQRQLHRREERAVGPLHRLDAGHAAHRDVVDHDRRVLRQCRDVGQFDGDGVRTASVPCGARHVERVQPAELAAGQQQHPRTEGESVPRVPEHAAARDRRGHPPAPSAGNGGRWDPQAPARRGPGSGPAPIGGAAGAGPAGETCPTTAGGGRIRSLSMPSGLGVIGVTPGRGLPLQVRHRSLRLRLGFRGVVDDLALVGGDAVDRVEQDRRVVHRDALQHRAHPLAADLGALVVVRVRAGVERAAADELDRVGEVRQRQQAADRALGRVVDVVEVLQPVGRDVQDLFDVVAVIGEDLGEVGELADLRRSAPRCSC